MFLASVLVCKRRHLFVISSMVNSGAPHLHGPVTDLQVKGLFNLVMGCRSGPDDANYDDGAIPGVLMANKISHHPPNVLYGIIEIIDYIHDS